MPPLPPLPPPPPTLAIPPPPPPGPPPLPSPSMVPPPPPPSSSSKPKEKETREERKKRKKEKKKKEREERDRDRKSKAAAATAATDGIPTVKSYATVLKETGSKDKEGSKHDSKSGSHVDGTDGVSSDVKFPPPDFSRPPPPPPPPPLPATEGSKSEHAPLPPPPMPPQGVLGFPPAAGNYGGPGGNASGGFDPCVPPPGFSHGFPPPKPGYSPMGGATGNGPYGGFTQGGWYGAGGPDGPPHPPHDDNGPPRMRVPYGQQHPQSPYESASRQFDPRHPHSGPGPIKFNFQPKGNFKQNALLETPPGNKQQWTPRAATPRGGGDFHARGGGAFRGGHDSGQPLD